MPVTEEEIESPEGCDIETMWRYMKQNPEVGADLIEGLIGPAHTVIWGDPKSGKTVLALQITKALTSGDGNLWGFPIPKPGLKVALVLTDVGAWPEAANKFQAMELSEQNCERFKYFKPPDGADPVNWKDLGERLKTWGADVAIIDNLLGFGGGEDFNTTHGADKVLACIERVASSGVRVVAVAHGRKQSQFSKSSPLGSVKFKATFRVLVEVKKQVGGTKVSIEGNSAGDRTFTLDRSPLTGLLSPKDGERVAVKAQAARDPITDKQHQIANHIVGESMTRAAGGKYLQEIGEATSGNAGEQQIDRTYVGAGLLVKGKKGKPLLPGEKLNASGVG